MQVETVTENPIDLEEPSPNGYMYIFVSGNIGEEGEERVRARTPYQRCRIWDKLHEEHINAGRTVQQLRSNIREMEKLCLKVHKDDLVLLKRMIDPVKEAAAVATAEFLQLHLESVEELKKQFNEEEASSQPSLTRSTTVGVLTATPPVFVLNSHVLDGQGQDSDSMHICGANPTDDMDSSYGPVKLHVCLQHKGVHSLLLTVAMAEHSTLLFLQYKVKSTTILPHPLHIDS
ncbi:hypothetical protein STEG23_031851 [Scotinomys teguina]